MPKKISDIRKSILKPVPPEYLKDRAGPGSKRLHYVEGDYVAFQLNEIFGVECVDITIPHHALEAERFYTKSVETKAAFNKETRTYEQTESKEVPAVEYSYGARVRIEVTVLDDAGNERRFVKEGIGAGTGNCAATTGASLHQARQIAMKYAETDAMKRAAKKIGTLFGLSIGENGKQQYAIDEDDVVDEITADNAPATAPAPSTVLSNTSDPKPAATAAKPAPVAPAKPVTQPSEPAPAPVTAQPQPPVAQATHAPAATTATTAPATPAPAAVTEPTSTAEPAVPAVDEGALQGMASAEWTVTFRTLNKTLEQSRSVDTVAEIARVAGCYFRLVEGSNVLDAGYKKQVKPLMTGYLEKHVKSHALQIDLAAAIKKGEDISLAPAEEEAFQAPF